MIRIIIIIIMVTAFGSLGVLDLLQQNWRTGIASILLGAVQALLFLKGK